MSSAPRERSGVSSSAVYNVLVVVLTGLSAAGGSVVALAAFRSQLLEDVRMQIAASISPLGERVARLEGKDRAAELERAAGR